MAEQIVMQRKVEGGPPAPANPLMPVAAGRITVGNLELSTIAGAAPPPERDGVDTSGSAAWNGGCNPVPRRRAANFGDAHRARCSTALLEWGDEAAATAVATAFNPTIVLGADVGYDPGSHAKLIATLKTCVSAGKVAGELADLVLIEEARFRDVSSWLWDSIKQAGFMLVERFDLGGKVAYLRFKLDDQVLV
ncbi:hypothetical protein JL722_11156 [Aureococcus anophagefferens]|nr:hypothetical protein JL722_11156 [Aureococcus anophagefferens]